MFFILKKLNCYCKPTTLLLVIGFSISLTAILVGVSTVNTLFDELSNAGSNMPILQTMQNAGLTLSVSIYLFSVINSFVVTNYWIITKCRDFAIRKAFGWTNRQLICLICKEMLGILLVSLCISGCLLYLLAQVGTKMLSVRLTPFFVLETFLLLIITLILSMIFPTSKIIRIEPAEVIS